MTAPQPATDATLWRHVATLTAWLDDANPRTDHEIAMRLMKLTEETGEVVSAYIGMTGQNPRKGITNTLDDVTSELCDVVITALVALVTLTGDTTHAETRMRDHLTARFARLTARIRDTPRPAPQGMTNVVAGDVTGSLIQARDIDGNVVTFNGPVDVGHDLNTPRPDPAS